MRTDRPRHKWNEDAVCENCGHDGADAFWQQQLLKEMVGENEFNSRRLLGEFDADRFCPKGERNDHRSK